LWYGYCGLSQKHYFRPQIKQKDMKKAFGILLIATFFFANLTKAQFEGVIHFERTKTETTMYTFTIKDAKIRVDDYGQDGSLKGIEMVDTKEGTVIAMSPERKLYYDATTKAPTPVKPEVIKTGNKKTIAGFECTEWVVKITLEDTEITYWVTDKSAGFTFFDDMLKTLNRKDKLAKYFMAVEGNEDVFPIEGIEKSLSGKLRTKLAATKIEPKSVEASIFNIPEDYQEFKR
jgi:hypothetical protein